jgi:hypothetical protein
MVKKNRTVERYGLRGKKLKVFGEDRVCDGNDDGDCSTVLSRYNKHGTCWAHTPSKVPRLRGRKQ